MDDVRPLRLTSELSVENLVTEKNGRTISVCIPARNEAATIAPMDAWRSVLEMTCESVTGASGADVPGSDMETPINKC